MWQDKFENSLIELAGFAQFCLIQELRGNY